MLLSQCISYWNIVITMLNYLEDYNLYGRYEPKDNMVHLTPYMFKKIPGSTPVAANVK